MTDDVTERTVEMLMLRQGDISVAVGESKQVSALADYITYRMIGNTEVPNSRTSTEVRVTLNVVNSYYATVSGTDGSSPSGTLSGVSQGVTYVYGTYYRNVGGSMTSNNQFKVTVGNPDDWGVDPGGNGGDGGGENGNYEENNP